MRPCFPVSSINPAFHFLSFSHCGKLVKDPAPYQWNVLHISAKTGAVSA
ncbi:hypothetical protein CBFG_00292 [Clostridiales bacterium 1_7_47FAA]|nr:hypothetical protein CBFG_00292 [Clostridiales bacterium 1_7_47FAA]